MLLKEFTGVLDGLQDGAMILSLAVNTFWDLSQPILSLNGQDSPAEICVAASLAWGGDLVYALTLRISPWSPGPSQWIWLPLVPPTPPVPPNLPMLTPTSYVVPQFMTRCCHPCMLVHAVPHTSPHLEIVPSLLIEPSNWMPVSSGMTATAN